MYFSCLLLYTVPCCFYLVVRFCYKPPAGLLLSFFYNISWDFTIFNTMHFCFWTIAFLTKGTQTSFMIARYFYSLYNWVIFSFVLLYWTGKLTWKMFKKVHRLLNIFIQRFSCFYFFGAVWSSWLFHCLLIWFSALK